LSKSVVDSQLCAEEAKERE